MGVGLTTLSLERHRALRIRGRTSFNFARHDVMVTIGFEELPKAAASLPIGFVEVDGLFETAALLGLAPACNLFVAPDGRWIGGYIPERLRAYPFQIARLDGVGSIMAIDETCDRLVKDGDGTALFDETGQTTELLQRAKRILDSIESGAALMSGACEALRRYNLFRPWNIEVMSGSRTHKLKGMFRIDEGAFRRLPAEKLKEVQESGGLAVAYCHFLSIQHLKKLARLSEFHTRAITAARVQAGFDVPRSEGADIDWERFFNMEKGIA